MCIYYLNFIENILTIRKGATALRDILEYIQLTTWSHYNIIELL